MHLLTYIRSAGAVATLLSILACGGDAARGSDLRPGNRGTITNDGTQNVPQWIISPEPVIDIGAADDQALVMVTAGVVSGEHIIVADVGAANLRWFDRSGRPIRTVGERGSGPGQFQYMGWMGLLPGDSLGVWDPALRRLTVFDGGGKLGRMTTIRFTRGPIPPVLGAFEDGTLLLADPSPSTESVPPGTAWRDTLVYLRVARDGTTADTLGRFPGAEWYAAGGPSGRVHSRPFGRQTAAAVQGNRFYVGTGDDYELIALGGDGKEQRRFRKPYEPVGLTAKDIEEYQSTSIQVGGTAEERRERAREMRDAPYPPTLPPYISLQLDDQGNVWAREPYQDATHVHSRWSVFSSSGQWIAGALGPGRFKVLQIGPDWVLGTTVDTDDVTHVGLYPLARNEAG